MTPPRRGGAGERPRGSAGPQSGLVERVPERPRPPAARGQRLLALIASEYARAAGLGAAGEGKGPRPFRRGAPSSSQRMIFLV